MIVANDVTTGQSFNLVPTQNLYTGINALNSHFRDSTSLEEDMLNLASGIYATDLAVRRKEREQYIRTIKLSIEVVNLHAFERVKDQLEEALYVLSGDNWTITFSQKIGMPEAADKWPTKDGVVLLFSGGLDSFAGAVHYIKQGNELVLVSHVNQNTSVSGSQNAVLKELTSHYNKSIPHYPYRVFTRKKGAYTFPEMGERENTQRTRSFLFLALAVITARKVGFNQIVSMAENGQFAIHLPLNQARVGPFSTHTANPKFLEIAENLFSTLFGIANLRIENPFLYKTKAEVTSLLKNGLLDKIESSVSCWMASHVQGKNHCGRCIPCLTRRVAIEHNGRTVNEYGVDLLNTDLDTLSPDNDGKRNLMDFLEFLTTFQGYDASRKEEFMMSFPELYNEAIDPDQALEMYHRVAIESLAVFSKYPHVNKYL
ncbi:MAG: 7-cyano-7-deazaguanine synthase [Bacteroidota bacterium]